MKKKLQMLLAIAAMVFVVNSSIYGQWNGGVHDLSNTPTGTTFDFFAGANPEGKLNSSATIATPYGSLSVNAEESFDISKVGAYTVAPAIGSAFNFFIYFLLCGVSTNR